MSYEVAQGLEKVALALDRLGTAGAATDMGAIELLAVEIKRGLEAMAISLDTIAESIPEPPPNRERFVQILQWGDELVALSNLGEVWKYGRDGWRSMGSPNEFGI